MRVPNQQNQTQSSWKLGTVAEAADPELILPKRQGGYQRLIPTRDTRSGLLPGFRYFTGPRFFPFSPSSTQKENLN